MADSPERANLAKLHISTRLLLCFITTIRPTKQRDIMHFHRKFSAGYPGLPSSLSRRMWEACNTVTRKKRMAREAQHSPRSNPLRQSSFFHLSYQVESLYCLSSLFPGPLGESRGRQCEKAIDFAEKVFSSLEKVRKCACESLHHPWHMPYSFYLWTSLRRVTPWAPLFSTFTDSTSLWRSAHEVSPSLSCLLWCRPSLSMDNMCIRDLTG